jgi:lysophospholipase I
MASPHAATLPLFWGHGTLDPLVEYNKMGEASVEFLKTQIGVPSTTKDGDIKGLLFNSYSIGHSTNQQELGDLKDWLKRVLTNDA